MDIPVKVINGKLICFKENHNEPITTVFIEQGIPKSEMLLCLKCLEKTIQDSKYISLEEAQRLLEEKLEKLNHQEEEQQKGILKVLNEFQIQLMNIRTRVIKQIDEILRISQLWIKDTSNIGRKSDINNFIKDVKLLQQDGQIDQNKIKKISECYKAKIDMIIQKLMNYEDYQQCVKILQSILIINSVQEENYQIQIIEQPNQKISQYQQQQNKQQDKQLNFKNVQLINTVKQEQSSFAIAFNNTGSIVVTGYDENIKSWNLEQGKMIEKKNLNGHTENVLCLFFSKKHNWFASGSNDKTIRCWKEDEKKDWISTQPGKSHSYSVLCLILNYQEDQLISCSYDQTIKVWKVNCQVNQLEYDYTLEKRHTDSVYCISLNDSETALVSCSRDERIILWCKDKNDRWIYKHELQMDDYGFRICFINENQFIWQQCRTGITHLLELNQGRRLRRSDLNLNLNQESSDEGLFPTIRNKKRQLIIQKHNRYVYILKQQRNGQLANVSEPIGCSHKYIYGNLTNDGEYFIIWDDGVKEFAVYNIKYE